MKKRMMNLLLELLKDPKRSDREIAKTLGVSQPTVTRRRQRLVKEGWIKDFTVIPDFVKMGYEIMAIIFFKLRVTEASVEKAIKVRFTELSISSIHMKITMAFLRVRTPIVPSEKRMALTTR